MYAAKAWVAALALILETLTTAFVDDVLSVEETGHVVSVVVVAIAGIVAVYRTPNKDTDGGRKSVQSNY